MICTCEGLSYPHTSNRTFLFKCARWSNPNARFLAYVHRA